jgi:carboxypeptidase family protein/TonB-dependent receptor-like protein
MGLFLMTAAPNLLPAGTTADLHGKIADGSGKPLPGVTVVLRNDTLALGERGAVTDAGGVYRFRALPPGPGYRLRAALPTFAPVEFSDLALEAGDANTLDIVLRPASELQETVRVKGHVDTVQPDSVVTSTTFTSAFIAGLPILGRDYQDILTLAPGVTDVNHTGNPNIHGARDTDVITLVDGVSTTDPFTGYYGQNLNIESIQEIEVITSAATAEFSRAQGGFANIITKSGGNDFTGTFKLFVRSHRLDGDGAGIDPPELTGGLGGAQSFAELSFTDLKPFLSVSGPILRDKLWYYLSNEYIQVENPVNALTQAFVTRQTGYRVFGKASWQATPRHRLTFSAALDKEKDENQGIDSLTDARSGYTFQRGGPTYTLKGSSVFKPTLLLESTASWFDNRFSDTPTTSPDTNGNGVLYVDQNHDGIFQASERDPGEDWDRDHRYDISEQFGGDLDQDGRHHDFWLPCEGRTNEDVNCDGFLDAEVDTNENGILDPKEDVGISCRIAGLCPYPDFVEPGTKGNGKFDTEDRNGNGVLDVVGDSGYTPTPFWKDKNGDGMIELGEYHAPLTSDQDLFTDENGRTFGPNPFENHDHRKRFTLRGDLSAYLADLWGNHDLKMGAVWEHEAYDLDTLQRTRLQLPVQGPGAVTKPGEPTPPTAAPPRISATIPYPANVNNTAVGDTVGLYLQDTYKPLPNLTLGLGIRADFENLASNGFTPFDPRVERRRFDGLMGAAGFDTNPYDSITNVGLCNDPIHNCTPGADFRLAQITSRLKDLAVKSFTRHNLDADFFTLISGGVVGQVPGSGNLGEIPPRRPEEFTVTNANLSPRLSISWDPWADGKSKAFASWGRYYDKLFLNSMVLEQGPDSVTRVYAFDPDGVDDQTGRPDYQLGTPLSQSPLSATQVDRNLATPHTDEWTAGFERELAPELTLGLRYIGRNFKDQLQDIDINHHLDRDPVTGRPADRIGFVSCGRGACRNDPDGLPDLYIENPLLTRVFRLGNYNAQTYRGWELELVRRLSRKWQMEASYTYSITKGDAENYLSINGDDPGLVEYEPGYLSYDQRHVIKLNALTYLPGDWRWGWTAQWSSGLPYSKIMNASDADDVGYFQSRILYSAIGSTGFGVTREFRNIHRNPAAYLFNTRIEKYFVIGKASASAFFEVYNLLNSDTLRVTSMRQIPPAVILGGPGTEPAIHPGYEVVVGERDFGRRFQVGIQIDF